MSGPSNKPPWGGAEVPAENAINGNIRPGTPTENGAFAIKEDKVLPWWSVTFDGQYVVQSVTLHTSKSNDCELLNFISCNSWTRLITHGYV